MRVVLVTYGSRGDVEPMIGLALSLRALGVDAVVCAPPDFAELAGGLGIGMNDLGWPIRPLAKDAATASRPKTLPDIAAQLTSMSYRTTLAAARGTDLVVATGSLPAKAGAQAAAESAGLPFVAAAMSPCYLPSPHHPPVPWPGHRASREAPPRADRTGQTGPRA